MLSSKQKKIFENIRRSIVNFDVEGIKKSSLEAIKAKINSEKIIETMGEGMNIVGKKYESGEYYTAELIIAGETMKEGLAVLKPYMTGKARASIGTAVVATVLGDNHDIGKNIFITLLTSAGFRVVDLGVDVSAEKIVEAVKESKADIVGLSALLTTNLEQMPIIIDELKNADLRSKVKVIVGGATVSEEFAKKIGADAYAKNALTGVQICKKWAEKS